MKHSKLKLVEGTGGQTSASSHGSSQNTAHPHGAQTPAGPHSGNQASAPACGGAQPPASHSQAPDAPQPAEPCIGCRTPNVMQVPLVPADTCFEWDPIINPFADGVRHAAKMFGGVEGATERLRQMQEILNDAQRRAGIRVGTVLVLAKHSEQPGDSPLGENNLAMVLAEYAQAPENRVEDIGTQLKPYPLVLGAQPHLARIEKDRVRDWRTSAIERAWVRDEAGRLSIRFLTKNGSIYEILAVCNLPIWHEGQRWLD